MTNAPKLDDLRDQIQQNGNSPASITDAKFEAASLASSLLVHGADAYRRLKIKLLRRQNPSLAQLRASLAEDDQAAR